MAPVGTICGNESLAYNERELYRAGIGPVAYSYRFSMSRGSGMSSWSSSATEHLALVASSLRGDVAVSGAAPVSRRPTPGPAPVRSIGGSPGTVRRPVRVATLVSAERAAAPSGRIAFSSDRDGDRETYVVNADGTGLTRLTVNKVNDYSPAFSPDGSKIAFISHPVDDGDSVKDSEIFVMTTRGANLTNLTNSEFYDTKPTWSPDGSKIAFTSNREAGFNVYVMNADGSDQKRLTVNDDRENTMASWAPDGAKIAFMSVQGNADVFLIDPGGSNETRLTRNPDSDFTPS